MDVKSSGALLYRDERQSIIGTRGNRCLNLSRTLHELIQSGLHFGRDLGQENLMKMAADQSRNINREKIRFKFA